MERRAYKPLILVIMLCFSCQPHQKSPIVPQQSCDVALAYAKDFQAKSQSPVAIFFAPTAEDLGMMYQVSIDQFLREHPEWKKNQKAQLEIDLIRKSEKFRGISVVEQCSALREWWKVHSIIHDDGAIRRVLSALPLRYSKEWKPLSNGILALSVPVMSDDGAVARLSVAEITNSEGGRFEVTYLRGADGSWHITDKLGGFD